MIAARSALLGKSRVASAASASSKRLGVASVGSDVFARRGFADVQVEHGRGEWKTYGDVESYNQGKYQIKTFNKLSPSGLARFPDNEYNIRKGEDGAFTAHAIMLRSHKLKEEEVPHTTRCIARYV